MHQKITSREVSTKTEEGTKTEEEVGAEEEIEGDGGALEGVEVETEEDEGGSGGGCARKRASARGLRLVVRPGARQVGSSKNTGPMLTS